MATRCAVVALMLGAVMAAPASAEVRVAGDVTETWYAATLNHRDARLSVLVLETANGRHLVRTLDLVMLEIPVPTGDRFRHAGETYVSADELSRRRLRLDAESGRAYFLDEGGQPRTDDPDSDLLLDVVLNGQAFREPLHVLLSGGILRLPPATVEALRLRLPDKFNPGEPVRVSRVAGENYFWNPRTLRLVMNVPVEYLAETEVVLQRESAGADVDWSPSTVLGYDLGVGRTGEGDESWRASIDLAASAGNVTCRTRHRWWSASMEDGRVDSACTADWPERALSLRVGDSVSRAGPMDAPVRYAGVRFGTDYSLQPYLVTQPLMGIAGSARVPSTLEVWVDRQLMATRRLPPGPFSVDDVTPLTGAGDMQAVITDPSGQQQVITAPFYADPQLLRPGLVDWAVEAGVVREGLFTPHDQYGDSFAQAGGRAGVSDSLTLEGQLQASDFGQAASVAAFVKLGTKGVLEVGAAASRGSGETGRAGLFGYSYRAGPWNVGVRHFQASEDYREVGHEAGGAALTRRSQVNAGLRFDRLSLSLGYIGRQRDGVDEDLATAAASWPIGDWGTVQLSVLKVFEPNDELTLAAHLTIPFGNQTQVLAGITGDPSFATAELGVQKNPPAGTGFGYRASAGHGPAGSRYLVDGTWRAPAADLRAQAHRINGHSAVQLSASGALLGNEAGISAARGGPGGYAVVTAPAEGIGIYLDNQLRARTDEDGRAVIAGLRPFESNRLSLEANELPLDSHVEDANLVLVPGRRSALAARFKVERVRQVFARLMLEGGIPVPAGAALHAVQGETSTVVGYGGMAALETLATGNLTVRATWDNRSCHAVLETGGGELGVLDLGEVPCRERPER